MDIEIIYLFIEIWNNIDITKDHITDIINKQILEKSNENELKRTKAKATEYKNIVIVQAKKSIPVELKKILKMKP